MEYGCIGEKLSHSYSKEIHAKIAPYEYELREVSRGNLDAFMRERDFKAINVTIPYKRDTIPYLYEMDEGAKRIGAVNTIVNRNGKLYGYNTDFYGMTMLIERLGVDLKGCRAAVLGTGGTSRTAQAVLHALGASDVIVVSRTRSEQTVGYSEFGENHPDIDFIVNTTPCGMYPDPEGSLLNVEDFPRLRGVVDAVYNPLRTNFVLDAQRKGIPASGGLYMLVAQATLASEIFMEQKRDLASVTDRIYREMNAEKENIVLIGMPGCGKTTVGEAVARKMNRECIDLDFEIVKEKGMSIPDIFQTLGEAAFRDMETECIRKKLQFMTGAVISVGGGAVLREENVRMLKRNGRLYFLNRDISKIMPTSDRPLALDRDMLARRFAERYETYLSACDVEIKTDETIANTVKQIEEDLKNR